MACVMSQPFRAPQGPKFSRMGRFKRMYLGVKIDTEYWGVFMLILIKYLGWGYGGAAAPAMDPITGQLLNVLNSSWRVIGVVAGGELTTDILSLLLGYFIRRYFPQQRHIIAPVFQQWHGGVVVAMWLDVGGFYLNGISSMGVLSDSLITE